MIPGPSLYARFLVAFAAWPLGCAGQGEGSWIGDLEVSPRIIRVHQNESARVSFVVRDRQAAFAGFARLGAPQLRSLGGYVLLAEGGERSPERLFVWRHPTPGHKVAIWDGTFVGRRNQPPVTGTYRVWVSVTDERGRTERAFRRVRIFNPRQQTVLPRTQSGLALRSLVFDGSHAVLTDEGGNAIRVRAVSGLKRNNPYNPTGLDLTRPLYQWKSARGPIPAGEYFIRKNDVQHPDVRDGQLVFPTGEPVAEWGPIRVMLHPDVVGNRYGFFLHLDVQDDGTAGCIGVHPADEGKFNQMMALIAWMPNDSLGVIVHYPGGS